MQVIYFIFLFIISTEPPDVCRWMVPMVWVTLTKEEDDKQVSKAGYKEKYKALHIHHLEI